jgi:hypothetical protein
VKHRDELTAAARQGADIRVLSRCSEGSRYAPGCSPRGRSAARQRRPRCATCSPATPGAVSAQARRRTAVRAEGIPVGARPIRACPDEPIYADEATGDHSPSRTVSCANARAASARVVLLGQATGSGLLLDEPDDVTRAVTKIYDNRRNLHNWRPARTTAPPTSH